MMIWILALLLLASGFGLGLRQGAIRTSFAFVGIVVATVFAGLLGKLFRLIMPHVGIHDPTLLWMIPPIEGFIVVWIAFKAVGYEVHRRVDVYYKYKAGDLRLALWERLNARLGACVGILNGTAWLVLISFLIFNFSYWTAQVAPGDNEARVTRIVNGLGEDLQSTGLDKAARSLGSMPGTFYKTANFAGLLAQNPNLSSRLGSYPAFLSLAERSDIQSLANDSTLVDAWKDGAPMGAILNDSQVKTILQDTNLVDTVWGIIQTNMDDLTNYLITGQSPKYDPEKIVGRWNFDLVPALAAEGQAHPKMRPEEMKALRALWGQAFAQTTFVAGTDGQAFLKNVPDFKSTPPGSQTWTGQWTQDGTNYDLSLNINGQNESATVKTDGLRLTIKVGGDSFVFQKAY